MGLTQHPCRKALVTRSVVHSAGFNKTCNALFGADGPSLSLLGNTIDAVCGRLQTMAREVGALPDDTPVAAGAADGASTPMPMSLSPMAAGGVITSRTQALNLFRQVAAYFRHAEPHSPVAYLTDKAAHSGSLPLHAWLRVVVKDRRSLGHIEELLGVDAEEDGRND